MKQPPNRRWMIPAVVLLLVATVGVGQTPEPLPGAMEYARKKFDGKLETAKREYMKRSIDARRAYLDDLDATLKVAMRDSRLEDANAINKEKSRIKEELETVERDPLLKNTGVRPGLAITRARYGADNRWDEVTALVRGKIAKNEIDLHVITPTFGHDPAPYTHKRLEIEGSTYGIDFVLRIDEGDHFTLKAP